MQTIKFEHPLHYPASHRPRDLNLRGYDNDFTQDMALEDALDYLSQELEAIHADKITLLTNCLHIGSPRLRKQTDSDTACCLSFSMSNKKYTIVSDRWSLLAHNIYALHLLLRQARKVEKWGFGTKADALLAFCSDTRTSPQPAPSSPNTTYNAASYPWMEILGLGSTATVEDANAVYRRRAKEAANDPDMLLTLNQAIEEARGHLS